MSDESLRELFRELHDEPVGADSLARVRAGVRRGIASRRKRWFAFLAFATAAVTFIAAFAFTPQQRTVTPRPPSPVPVTVPAILEQPGAPEAVRPRMTTITRRKKRELEKPVLIRIETADPEVVILLVGN